MIGRRSRMKGHGLLAGIIIGVLVFSSLAMAISDGSVFDTAQRNRVHKFGIQVTGSGGMFAMDDVNNYFLTPIDNISVGDYNEAEFGIGGGIALLYRSADRVRWHIGYNYLGQESFEGTFTNTDEGTSSINEHATSGSEFYVAANYLYPFSDELHLYFGGGISLIRASVDRITSQNEFDPAVYDANGLAFGGRAEVGAELMLTDMFAITGALGYRYANVKNLDYEDLTGARDEFGNVPIEDYVWDANNNRSRKIGVDFSGPFAEFGIRMYFEASAGWYHP